MFELSILIDLDYQQHLPINVGKSCMRLKIGVVIAVPSSLPSSFCHCAPAFAASCERGIRHDNLCASESVRVTRNVHRFSLIEYIFCMTTHGKMLKSRHQA